LPNRKPVRTSGQPDPTRTSIDSLASGGRRQGGGGYGGGNRGGNGGGGRGFGR
jgi:ATP-dependent RNA helicase RhlE